MKPEKNNTFCTYPFFQIALKDWNKGQIYSAAPCCNSIRPENIDPLNLEDQISTLTHEEIFNSDVMKELRQNMIKGKRHDACTTCWKMEDAGITSYRLHSKSEIITEEMLLDPKLTCIDFSFGENCNLRCRMCQPSLSNKLRIDYKNFYKLKLDTTGIQGFELNDEFDDRVKWLEEKSENEVLYWSEESWQFNNILDNITKIKKLKAAGGETTLTKPFLRFIDKAIEGDHAKNVTLMFHTNATKFTDDLLDKLIQFESLELNFSIDSYGKNYEYVRFPMTWNALDKSLKNFFERTKQSNVKVRIQFTNVLSVLNAFNIHEIYSYWQEIKNMYPHIIFDFWVDFIWPEKKYINVKFLTKELKIELINYYTQTFKNHTYPIKHIIEYLEKNLNFEINDQNRKDMLREILLFDKSRNQDYKDYLDHRICKFLETEIK